MTVTTFTPTVRIECGDALDLLRREPDGVFDLCVTSPPYADLVDYGDGVRGCRPDQYADWLPPYIAEVARVLRPGGALALNIGAKHGSIYPEECVCRIARETDLVLWERVCWVKANPSPTGERTRHLVPSWEPIYVFAKPGEVPYFGRDDLRVPYEAPLRRTYARNKIGHKGGRRPLVRQDRVYARHPIGKDASNVLWAAVEGSRAWKHPARFPEALPAFFIRAYCPEGGWVLDPFVGSGTTIAVAAELGRNAVGFDIKPEFAAMAERRVYAAAQPRLDLPDHDPRAPHA